MSSKVVEEIKEKLDIVELVGSYIDLKQSGSSLKAPCPFHNEKTPSFFVSPDRGTYYCFGCGKKGDIFSFVQEFEGLDFVGVLKLLGDRTGVKVDFKDDKNQDKRQKQFTVLNEATEWFQANLTSEKEEEVIRYLKEERGLTDDSIKSFRIGYVPEEWNALYDHLKSKNYSDQEIEEVGLAKKSDKSSSSNKYYDRFRSRIMFPIFDVGSRIVGYTGRIFGGSDKDAKYLNSPETELFNKSKILYCYNFAKTNIRKNDFSILVEGQMDVILAHQAGYKNTIATSGTALASDQIDLLERLSKKIVIALDGDGAGFRASERAWKMALAKGMDVKIAVLPEGKDPADVIKENPKDWKGIIKKSQHIIDFLIHKLDQENVEQRVLARRIKENIIPYISELPNAIEQDHFIKTLSKAFGINRDVLRKEVDKYTPDNSKIYQDTKKESGINSQNNTKIADNNKINKGERRLFGIILWQEKRKEENRNKNIKLEEVVKEVKGVLGESIYNDLKEKYDQEDLFFKTEEYYLEDGLLEKEVPELLLSLKKGYLKNKREELKLELNKAEYSNDSDKQREILREIQKISSFLDD